jgi:hypothetical protein
MLGNAVGAYHQRKDEMKHSSQHSSSTVSKFLPLTREDITPPITDTCRMGDTKVIPPPTQGKEHTVVTRPPTKEEEADVPMPIPYDLIIPAMWNLQIPKQPSETLDEFGKCCATMTRLMSDPRTAALLSTMAATPEVYIEANHYASTQQESQFGVVKRPGSKQVWNTKLTMVHG